MWTVRQDVILFLSLQYTLMFFGQALCSCFQNTKYRMEMFGTFLFTHPFFLISTIAGKEMFQLISHSSTSRIY